MFRVSKKPRLFVALAALVFVVAFAATSSAFMAGSSPFTYTGKIAAIDLANGNVVVAGDDGRFIFELGKDAVLTRCNAVAPLNDLRIGDDVTVSYHEESNGMFIAGDINLLWTDMGMRRC